jgi:maltooligosyltrehalose trehalohydrolase
MHRDLLKLRREDPVFSQSGANSLDGAVLAEEAFAVRFFGQAWEERLLLVNLGRDLRLSPIPEPLLAPPQNCAWEIQWSSENPDYGGSGTSPRETGPSWLLPGHAALVLKNVPGGNLEAIPGAP